MNELTIFLTINQSQGKNIVDWCFKKNFLKKPYGHFLWMRFNRLKDKDPLSGDVWIFTFRSPGVPGTHFINLERLKAKSTLGFKPRTPRLEIQHFNHKAIASTLYWKIIGSNLNYMIFQALKPNYISRLRATFGYLNIKCSD